MSVVSEIRGVLVTRIGALSSVQKVYGYENPKPTGWPAVFVTSSQMTASFVTNVENRRVFTFDIIVVFPTGQNIPKSQSENPVAYAEDRIYEVFDQIADDMDQNAFTEAFIDIGDADSTYLFADAADAEWGFFQYEGGIARALKIPLSIKVDFRARTT